MLQLLWNAVIIIRVTNTGITIEYKQKTLTNEANWSLEIKKSIEQINDINNKLDKI